MKGALTAPRIDEVAESRPGETNLVHANLRAALDLLRELADLTVADGLRNDIARMKERARTLLAGMPVTSGADTAEAQIRRLVDLHGRPWLDAALAPKTLVERRCSSCGAGVFVGPWVESRSCEKWRPIRYGCSCDGSPVLPEDYVPVGGTLS